MYLRRFRFEYLMLFPSIGHDLHMNVSFEWSYLNFSYFFSWLCFWFQNWICWCSAIPLRHHILGKTMNPIILRIWRCKMCYVVLAWASLSLYLSVTIYFHQFRCKLWLLEFLSQLSVFVDINLLHFSLTLLF